MRLFAVRTTGLRQPVGFFWVRDLEDLPYWVDAVCDPDDCEYKPINEPAALVWDGDEKWQMGVDNMADDPDETYFQAVRAGIRFDGELEMFTCGMHVEGWTPIFAQPAARK